MPPAAVKAWKQVLELLQEQQALFLQTDGPAADSRRDLRFKAIKQRLDAIDTGGAVPRAAWKTIIRDMEVGPSDGFL
jgi:hypothetical protein